MPGSRGAMACLAVLAIGAGVAAVPGPMLRSAEAHKALAMARQGLLDVPKTLVVKTPSGAVQGTSLNGTWMWRGIPFAKPPIGDLRFAPPVLPDSWNMTLNTTSYAASCMQMGSPSVGGRWRGAAWTTLNITDSSEDCLYLNVHVPEKRNPNVTAPLLPVMVYMHAGEFRFGAANDRESGFPYFAEGSVILVTANARLSLMGFAALDRLRSRDTTMGSTGNYGVQDQRAVLKWVQETIMYFGGDPDSVTIFGESSGGASVGFHVTSNLTKGLFTRAILESPGLTQSKTWNQSESNTQFAVSALTAATSPSCAWLPGNSEYREFPGMMVSSHHSWPPSPNGGALATAATAEEGMALCNNRSDCYLVQATPNGTAALYGGGTAGQLSESGLSVYDASRHTAKGQPLPFLLMRMADQDTAVECLTKASAADLISINMSPPFGDTFFTDAEAPTVDGVELLADLQEVVRDSVPAGTELLGGANLDEGTEFLSSCPPISCNASVADFTKWSIELFGEDLGPKVPALYTNPEQPYPLCGSQEPYTGDITNYIGAMRSAGDSAILCRTREFLTTASLTGGNGFWYQFTATPIASLNMDRLPYMGSFHGAEVPFVFGFPAELSSDGERALSKAMGCYWVNFASTGNPNFGPASCGNLPEWREISTTEGGVAIQFSNTSIKVVEKLYQPQCDLFAQYP
eukprot:m.452204 g.452204  ORF g.452204 m.452204 type:complete len:689 (+) comp20286_c0_seq1:60-2126(+)